MIREAPPLDPNLAALLSAGKAVPRQAEAVRARAIVRARAAIATGAAFDTPPLDGGRRRRRVLFVAACAGMALGVAGAAVAYRLARRAEARYGGRALAGDVR